MKTCIAALVVGVGLAANAMAGTAYYNGALTSASQTTHIPGTSTTTPGIQYYDVQAFTVDVTGSYVIESASPNTAAGSPSNALDTFLALYANSFNPVTPGTPQSSNDDFTGTLTVLPGPYAGTITTTSTGFSGAQPGSRLAAAALTAGTTYYLVTTSFRQVGYVNTTDGAAVGAYYNGISGQGNITLVPAPGAAALLGLGGLIIGRRRR